MFTVTNEDGTKKLTSAIEKYLIGQIPKLWDQWDDDRKICNTLNAAVMKQVNPVKKADGRIEQLPDLYEAYQGFNASFWKDWFKNYDSTFTTRGRTRLDNENASLQKDALINNFEDINFEECLYKMKKEAIKTGEVTVFVYWRESHRQIKSKKSEQEINREKAELLRNALMDGTPISESILDAAVDDEKVENIVDFRGADIKVLEAKQFVYDVNKKDDWNACPKIFRNFLSYQQIAKDKVFSKYLNKAKLKELRDMVKPSSSSIEENEILDSDKDQMRVHKGNLEVLDYWGDLQLEDGTILENWLCTVVAGKYIIRYEQNPYLDCPLVHACFLEHEEKKRGLSLLLIALSISQTSDEVLKSMLKALKLIINKCFFGPEGALEGELEVKPGGYIGYDPDLMDHMPVPLDFKDALVGENFLRFFEAKIESGTGVYKNMTGDIQSGVERTATEVIETTSGANTRLNEIIDFFNFTLKIPVIRKMATLLANFKFEEEEIEVHRNGITEYKIIDEGVRKGKYKYTIGGSDDIAYKRHIFREALPMIVEMMKDPSTAPAVNRAETIKWIFENVGVKDPGRLVNFEMLQNMVQNPMQNGAQNPMQIGASQGMSLPVPSMMPEGGQSEQRAS